MRLALMTAALTPLAALAACGGQPETAGPERRSAAGEVLGGEVTDDMLPLDTARSTSPPDPRAEPRAGPPDAVGTATSRPFRGKTPPRPQISGGPAPDASSPTDPPPPATPPPE